MLVNRPQSKIIEKIITDRKGQQMRVTFLVTEILGNLQVKVLSVAPIVALTSIVLTIAGNVLKLTTKFSLTLSEFVAGFSDFAFFMSQPTRAPSHI